LENLDTGVDINRAMWYLFGRLCNNRFLCGKRYESSKYEYQDQ
jgi:hypothetical protein